MKRRQDAIFNLYIIPHVEKVYIIDVPTYHYRQRATSVCHMISSDQHSMFRRVNSEVYQFMQKYQLWPDLREPYYYVVVQGILELCRLYGQGIRSRTDFTAAFSGFRSFCEEEECAAAIMYTKAAVMPSAKGKAALYLLKRHMYRTIIMLRYIQGKCRSRTVRSV